jgi:hypothetical protein
LAVAGAIFALAPAVSPARGSERRPSIPGEDALEVVLRLRDLPLGYVFSGGSPLVNLSRIRCDRVDPADPQPQLARFLERRAPAGCITLYQRSYRVPGGRPEPLVTGSGALRLGSVSAAEEGLAVSQQLISHALDDELPEEVAPAATIGEATRLFHWRHDDIFSEDEESCSFLVWRSGGTVAAVFVAGGSAAANDRAATELARRQQRRMEAPTRFKRADFDDREVGLENPALRVPVYWLGTRFRGRGLPALRLEGSSSDPRRGAGRFPRYGLAYATPVSGGHWEAIFLSAFTNRQWKRLRDDRRRLPGVPLCDAAAHRLAIEGRNATVFSGSEGSLRNCRKRGAPTWTLRLRVAGLVVVAETSQICAVCARSGAGPYDSLAGMTAIARGLERRPKSRIVR